MSSLKAVYVPVGVPTFHLESAQEQFELSVKLLKDIDPDFICPDGILLSTEDLRSFLSRHDPDFVVFQNATFANAAYMSEVLRRSDCPVLLWTLREPVIDGGRLRLNSLTGAYSAANTLRSFGGRQFEYLFGAPGEQSVIDTISACTKAAYIRKQLRELRMAAVGHTPQGFGFGRALDAELMQFFGVELESIEVRELIDRARGYSDEECVEYLHKSRCAMCGLEKIPEDRVSDYAKLYKAYADYVSERGISALASRCWPDFFTVFGTPVCAVLSMLNHEGIAAACEADVCGALSMWIGMQFSAESVFFGDPVSLDERENTITYWHCGAAACSLARNDTGAVVGVHPNRKIGPVMDFGCQAMPDATVFRIGREPDGSFRFFIMEGEGLDRPKQFTGTSIVIKTDSPVRKAVEQSVRDGFEPHFVVIRGRHADGLEMLAHMLGMKTYRY